MIFKSTGWYIIKQSCMLLTMKVIAMGIIASDGRTLKVYLHVVSAYKYPVS